MYWLEVGEGEKESVGGREEGKFVVVFLFGWGGMEESKSQFKSLAIPLSIFSFRIKVSPSLHSLFSHICADYPLVVSSSLFLLFSYLTNRPLV